MDADPAADRQEERAPEGHASILMERRIEWPDTDASGFYHNTAVVRLLETAETLLLDRLGFVHEIYGRLPRAHFSADFLKPLAFRDPLEVTLTVEAVGRTSVTYSMVLRRNREECVRAKAVAVLLDHAGGRPTRWPGEIRTALLTAGPQPAERLVAED
jgi:YbgC/YbaW family acyl-CoA thioester hydrolase